MEIDHATATPIGALEKDCPVRTGIAVIAGKWKPAILRAISESPRRYVDIRSEIRGITDQALTRHLRELRADGVLEHHEATASYCLTRRGEALAGIMEALEVWGAEYLAMRLERKV
jgi:DNA-binding HxlR family transcriptional regulator